MNPDLNQIGLSNLASHQVESAPQGGFDWNAGIDATDQFQFENTLSSGSTTLGDPSTSLGVHPSANATLGDAILNQLESLRHDADAMQAEIFKTLGKDNLSPSDMLKVQYQLMSVNLEIQTTSNMAHHGVEDVKTIMRGQ